MRRALLLAASLVIAALAPAVAAGSGAVTAGVDAATANHTAPPDPEGDPLGWEGGYWHNESLDVDQSDGLSEEEFRAVMLRSMARVEYIRGLEFEGRPDPQFISRDAYSQVVSDLFEQSNVSTADRLHQNVKFEALYLVGEDTSFFDIRRQNQQGFAAAFHVNQDVPAANLSEGDLGIVLDGGSLPQVREPTLGHELSHFVQNERFDNSEIPYGTTEDSASATTSIVEGDPEYMQVVYQRRCGDQWECLDPPERSSPPVFPNLGLVVYNLFPYGEGPDFVQSRVAEEGWDRVNDLYDEIPATTEQVIYPEKYPDDRPREITVEDRSTEEWRIPQVAGNDSANYASFGEAGLFVMLWYPGYASRERVVMAPDAVFTAQDSNPYNFSHPASRGWNGDRLYPYVNDSSAATNETGYVWKIAWDSPADAREFAEAYEAVVDSWGGERVGEDTWRLPERRQFGDAVHLERAGDTVTIVNAPTVEDLTEIRGDVTVEPTATATETTGAVEATETAVEPTATDTTAFPGTPGFTPVAALLALAAAAWYRCR